MAKLNWPKRGFNSTLSSAVHKRIMREQAAALKPHQAPDAGAQPKQAGTAKLCKRCGAKKYWQPGRKRGGSRFCSNTACSASKHTHDERNQRQNARAQPGGEPPRPSVWGDDDENEFEFAVVSGPIADALAAMPKAQALKFAAWFHHPPSHTAPATSRQPQRARKREPETYSVDVKRIVADEVAKRRVLAEGEALDCEFDEIAKNR